MGFRLGVIIFLMVALSMVVESSSFRSWDTISLTAANMKVGQFINQAEEMMMDSEASRRVLAGRNYISYGALQKNNVPCNRRGNSYYNCNSRGKANPYSRGCNTITRCGRRR